MKSFDSENPFKVGNKIILQIPLAEAIKFDNWVGEAGIQENTVYEIVWVNSWAVKVTASAFLLAHHPFKLRKKAGFIMNVEDF